MIVSAALLITLAIGSIYVGSIFSVKQEQIVDPENESDVVDLNLSQVLMMPVTASASLLLLFYFFEYIQYVMVLFISITSLMSFNSLFRFVLEKSIFSKSIQNIVSIIVTGFVVVEWIRTGNFIYHNLLGCALAITCISTLRFPSLKIASICLVLLLFYDIFWVFYSSYFFGSNVMVNVATKAASSPIQQMAQHYEIPLLKSFQKQIDLPLKLIVPTFVGPMLMLGLGDIILPGLLVAFALRVDLEKSSSHPSSHPLPVRVSDEEDKEYKIGSGVGISSNLGEVENFKNTRIENGEQTPATLSKTQFFVNQSHSEPPQTYLFEFSLVGYALSLILAMFMSRWFHHPQPALIYLVPGTMLAIVCRGLYLDRIFHTHNHTHNHNHNSSSSNLSSAIPSCPPHRFSPSTTTAPCCPSSTTLSTVTTAPPLRGATGSDFFSPSVSTSTSSGNFMYQGVVSKRKKVSFGEKENDFVYGGGGGGGGMGGISLGTSDKFDLHFLENGNVGGCSSLSNLTQIQGGATKSEHECPQQSSLIRELWTGLITQHDQRE